MSEGGTGICTLISASCTTGWRDWTHGELWLCPEGLLRRSLGLATTIRHSSGPTVDQLARASRSFAPNEIAAILAAGRRNRWITWREISKATLKRGVIDHSLHLELVNGKREKFLWLRVDGGWDLLEPALRHSLPGRFALVNKAFG